MVELSGNVLLLQIGKPTPVTNVGLNALINSVLNYDSVEDVYGCLDGMSGLLVKDFIDLASQSQKNVQNLLWTPGAALGSAVISYTQEDYERVVEILKISNIRFLFILGDDNCVNFCAELEKAINKLNYDVRIILIPFSMDNSLPLTDHCLGYASAAKHIATLFNDVTTYEMSLYGSGVVTIIELVGCENLWLLNTTALIHRRSDSQKSHIILANVFDEQILINKIQKSIRDNGNCVVVLGKNLTNRARKNILDGKSVGKFVEQVVKNNFDLNVNLVSIHDWYRVPSTILSAVDVEETIACAQKAVELAVENAVSGKMMILLRTEGTKYTSEISCVDICNIVGKRKEFPEGWYNFEETNVDYSFFKYALPLISGEQFASYDAGIPTFSKIR